MTEYEMADNKAAAGWDAQPFLTWLIDEQMRPRGWNQTQLAKAAAIRLPTVNRWIVHHTRPTAASALRLAEALNVTPDYVLHLTGHRPWLEEVPDAQRDRFIAALRQIELTPERVEILEDILLRWLARDLREAHDQPAAPDGAAVARRVPRRRTRRLPAT